MTPASLSERKLHPFFSVQQRNYFQKGGAGPLVIWLQVFIKSANEREHISAHGPSLAAAGRSVLSGTGSGPARGEEGPGGGPGEPLAGAQRCSLRAAARPRDAVCAALALQPRAQAAARVAAARGNRGACF